MIKIEGVRFMRYSGTWSSIKQENICGVTYFLMESDLFGDIMYHITVSYTHLTLPTTPYV